MTDDVADMVAERDATIAALRAGVERLSHRHHGRLPYLPPRPPLRPARSAGARRRGGQAMSRPDAQEWRVETGTKFCSRGHWLGPFSIYEGRETGRCVLSSGAPYWIGPIHTDNLDEAKAIVAAIIAPPRDEQPGEGE